MKASILLIAYNQARFVEEAVRSAMAQDYLELELVVCDDASPDSTRDIIERTLKDCPPHIGIVRSHNQENMGLLANFNRGMAACSGEIIIPMAGDDISLPNRVSTIVREFAANPRCMLVYSNWSRIDADGSPLPGSCRHRGNRVFTYGPRPTNIYAGGKGPGSAAGYRACLHHTFGPLAVSTQPEDRSYWVRALLLGDIHYLSEPLMKWRTHDANVSNYQGGRDTDAARKRILRDLLYRQSYGRQFLKDIDVAVGESLISEDFATRLKAIIAEDREVERLRRYSLSRVPWRLWLGSARRLMRDFPSLRNLMKIVRWELPIFVSSRKRERHWAKKIRKGKD